MKRHREILIVVGVFLTIFAICCSELGYISYLRRKVSQAAPDEWRTYLFNGATNLLVPWLPFDGWDNVVYASRVKQIYLHGYPVDPHLKEYRGFSSWISGSLAFYIVALLGWPLGKMQLIWPFVAYLCFSCWFLLFYWYFRGAYLREGEESFKGYIPVLVLAAFFPLCFSDYFRYFNIEREFNPWTFNIGRELVYLINFGYAKRGLIFLRLPSSVLTSLLLFAWLAAVTLRLGRSSGKGAAWGDIILGASGSLLALVHYPEAAYASAAVGTAWAILMVTKWPGLEDARWPLTRITFSMAATVIPLLLCSMGGSYQNLDERITSYYQPYKVHFAALLIPSIAALVYARRSRRPAAERWLWIILASSLFGGFLLSQCDVLGFRAQFAEIMRRYGNISLSLMVAAMIVEAARRRPWMGPHAGWAALTLLMLTFFNFKSASEKFFRLAGLPREWENAFSWINQNTPKDAKFLTLSTDLNALLTLYTPAKIHVGYGFPMISNVPSGENCRRMAVFLKTFGISPEIYKLKMVPHPDYPSSFTLSAPPLSYFHKGWAAFIGAHLGPGQTTKMIEEYYREVGPLQEPFYFWINKGEEELFRPPEQVRRNLTLVYQNELVSLHSYHPPL